MVKKQHRQESAAAALGKPASLSGARTLVAPWGGDGGYRALDVQPQPYAIGGGAPGAPKVMGAPAVIVLP